MDLAFTLNSLRRKAGLRGDGWRQHVEVQGGSAEEGCWKEVQAGQLCPGL